MRLFHPEVFQGDSRKKSYFEGWYFKHVSADLNHVYSFIPGVAFSPGRNHAFIQIINGITGETRYIEYDIGEFEASRKRMNIRVGKSVFSGSGIDLDIAGRDFTANGRIEFFNSVHYPKTILAPGIMGWYSYVPFMECRHGVVSVNHALRGKITVNGQLVDFTGGQGYSEKDWGTSFPEAWIWLQCNTFGESDRCLFFSVAKIPWLGSHFMGLICFLYDKGTYYLFATYNKSKLRNIICNGDIFEIELENRHHALHLRARRLREGELAAPVLGVMSRRIKESVDSEVDVRLSDKQGRLLVEDSGKRAGLEIVGRIEELLRVFHHRD